MSSLVVDDEKYLVSVQTGDDVVTHVHLPEINRYACMARINKDNYSQQCNGHVHTGEFCEKHTSEQRYGRVDQLPSRPPTAFSRWQNDEFQLWQNRQVDIERSQYKTTMEHLLAEQCDVLLNFLGKSVPTSPISFKASDNLKKPVAKKSALKKKRPTPKQKTKAVRKSAATKCKEAKAQHTLKRRKALAAKRKAKVARKKLSENEKMHILYEQGYKCNRCKESIHPDCFDIDHIVELQDGGSDTCRENLQALCCNCHRKKTAECRRARKARK